MNTEFLHRFSIAICLIVVSASGGLSSSMAADLGIAQGTQWFPYLEWIVRNPTWSGIAFDVIASVEFTHPSSGEKRRIQMFFAGGKSYFLPLHAKNSFQPDLATIPPEVTKRAKMIWINYPNNPTAAVAEGDFFEAIVAFGHRHGIMVCHDLTYSEIAFNGYKPMSLLEVDGAREIGIEFHSLSKTFNMTGWRIAFAVGNREAIKGLGAIKSNLDSGVFQAIQIAGITALKSNQEVISAVVKIYERRRDIMVKGLNDSGFEVNPPKATFYLWVPVPHPYTSIDLATRLLMDAGVVVTPGNGFGPAGDGYIRIALTQDEKRLLEATERIHRVGL